MLAQMLDQYRKGKRFDELEALAARLIDENARLMLEAAKLRKENRSLRRQLADHEMRSLRRAQVDAELIGLAWYAGLPISRRSCEDYGISRRRWAWARALLLTADLLDEQGITLTEFGDFDRILGRGVGRVEEGGLGLLRARLPRNGYAGRKLPTAPRGHARGHAPRANRDHSSRVGH